MTANDLGWFLSPGAAGEIIFHAYTCTLPFVAFCR